MMVNAIDTGKSGGPISTADQAGVTLVEVTIVMVIMALTVAMAIPVYSSAMDIAQEQTAIADINSISDAIDSFFLNTGALPKSLQQIGMENTKDPWGNPYIYKPVDGTDGREPSAETEAAKDAAREAKAAAKGGSEAEEAAAELLDRCAAKNSSYENATFAVTVDGIVVADLDSDGNYDLKIPDMDLSDVERILKAKMMTGEDDLPLNVDYDLYSLGPNGDTAGRIDDDLAKDDIIRARRGHFVDRAEKYSDSK